MGKVNDNLPVKYLQAKLDLDKVLISSAYKITDK